MKQILKRMARILAALSGVGVCLGVADLAISLPLYDEIDEMATMLMALGAVGLAVCCVCYAVRETLKGIME